MKLMLEGNLVTPMITQHKQFILKGCKATIIKPRRRYYSKINTAYPMYPYSYICYLGTIQLEYNQQKRSQLLRKLRILLKCLQLGPLQREGLGKIHWIKGKIITRPSKRSQQPKQRKIRIRKGLPLNLTPTQQEILRYALLHDFFHTPRHQSKIYVEPPLSDEALKSRLRAHHEQTSDLNIQLVQKYDQIAAGITRKIRSPVRSRYNWKNRQKNTTFDFLQLAKEIAEKSNNVWELYRYIYQSSILKELTEAMVYGHSTLRRHLLILANLIVQAFFRSSTTVEDKKKAYTPLKPPNAVSTVEDGKIPRASGQRIGR
jgi:hypothetical protein